jgi:hypothetical protein
MPMREQDGVNATDVKRQRLRAKIRTGVDQQ